LDEKTNVGKGGNTLSPASQKHCLKHFIGSQRKNRLALVGLMKKMFGCGVQFIFCGFALQGVVLIPVALRVNDKHFAERGAVASSRGIELAFHVVYHHGVAPGEKL
jgi:hypothetical protein